MVNKGIVLGHKISERGIKVDRAKVEAIEKMPCRRDKPEPPKLRLYNLNVYFYTKNPKKELNLTAFRCKNRLEPPLLTLPSCIAY
jgi:hypothetical protein